MSRRARNWRAATGVMTGRAATAQIRVAARNAAPLFLLGFLVWAGHERLLALDWQAVFRATLQMPPFAWALATIATIAGFMAVGHYDALVHRLLGTGVGQREARRSGMAAIAISQMAGFGLITGTLTRWHLLPGQPLAQAGRVTLTVTVSFLAAWALVTGLAVLTLRDANLPYGATLGLTASLLVTTCLGCLLIAVLLPRLHIAGRRFDVPPVAILARFTLMAATDLGAAALVLYVFLPETAGPFVAFLPVFLLAFGAGLLFGTPGGIGPFELVLAALSPMIAAEGLAAAILCYRIAYFALPALIAAGLVAAGCLAPAATDIRPAPSPLPAPPQAEAGLLRQGFLETLTGPEGGGWIAGRSGQSLVALLDPFGDAPLATLREAARQRGLVPALYKCGPRTALMARAQGWKVQPIAEECWLDPSRFTLDSPLRATLRRKLRHAERAGIVVTCAPADGDLPLDQMACLNRDWAECHGAERGFSMGRFTPDYVAGQKVYLAWLNGNLAAFVTFHQAADEWTLDLVRQGAEAPDGTIPALVHAAISEAARANLPRLSLAARPLTGYGLTGRAGRWAEWCALRSGAEGLRRFKAMFAPNCTRLYLAAPSRLSLVLSAIEIARAICWPPPLPCSAAIARRSLSDDGNMSETQQDPDEVEFESCRAA